MLIDFHTHAFPPHLAPRATGSLSFNSGGIRLQTDGTLASLKEEMKKDGVDISVVLNIATNVKQQTNVNNFAIEIDKDDSIIAFGSVHPDAPNVFEELERIKAAGLKGVKFHPEYQGFFVDEERMKPIYKKIGQLGLVTTFHSGYDQGFLPPYHCMPQRLKKALKWFDSPVIAAHWGALMYGEGVMEHLCGENVYFDISYGYGVIAKPVVQKIVELHGTHRLVFGSDMPWHRPKWELTMLESIGLSQEDMDKIKYKNAAKLLGLDHLLK